MIKPTIGRKVWYWPGSQNATFNVLDSTQPLDATVVFVHDETMVNLLVVDHVGQLHDIRNASLAQSEDDRERFIRRHEYTGFAEWVPYQVKAAKEQV